VIYTDDLGRTVTLAGPPERAVSLAPGATEILCALDAGDAVAAVTLDDYYFECIADKPRTGPRDKPDWALVAAAAPDLVIVEPGAAEAARTALARTGARVVAWAGAGDLAGAESGTRALGALFGRRLQAERAVAESRAYTDAIAKKTAGIPPAERKRVMRLRALPDGGLGTGGPGTVDRAIVEAAGGVPWPGGEPGSVGRVTPEEFASFDPHYVYACEEDRAAAEAAAAEAPWNGASAFRDGGRVRYFPCALTDRLSAHAGYFIAWLSADVYSDWYGDPANLALPQEILGETPVAVEGIPYVKGARIVEYRLFDFVHRTLLIDFTSPQTVVTTGDGAVHGVTAIGNSYSPPMVWNINHKGGWKQAEDELFRVLGLDRAKTSLIFTGADMRNLSVRKATHEDLTVVALVTAGAESNALRTSRDPGAFYEPGTINVIVLSSRKLSPGGAAGAVIVATEAKTAALWDMDVRSSESPLANPATGTGTDDVMVPAAGDGKAVDYTGGHGKVGELVARVVYDGVTEALLKQNGKHPARSVWERLGERGVDVRELGPAFSAAGPYPFLAGDVKALLTDPLAASLLESAFSLSDAAVMGHLKDPALFDAMALRAASGLAGGPVPAIRSLVEDEKIPAVLKTALDALATAALARQGL
jgi:adenosylcobinamide amidohydrolase/ABC-type Fe3+-hydroxamate transport system substrate-binding protein